MTELCKSCYASSETVTVQVRHGERGTAWEDSTIKRCANNDCWSIVEGTTADKLVWIKNVYDYKYFGDYPLSEEQLAAVYAALGLASGVPALEAMADTLEHWRHQVGKLQSQIGKRDDTMRETLGWIRHWQADVAGNLKPTPDSLAMVEAKILAVLEAGA